MQFGINIANHRDLMSKRYIVETARLAEDLGLDSVWIPDHIIVPTAVEERYGPVYYEPLTVLAYLAGVTRRVQLGTTVLIIPYRHPIVTAKAVASIDQLCDGRLILGVGTGWAEAEFQILKLSFAERGRVTDEYLRIMQTLWQQEAPHFSGQYYTFGDFLFAPRPVQQPTPPIWVGGSSGAALRRAAEFAVAWHPNNPALETLPQDLQKLHRLCQERGRAPVAFCPRFTVQLNAPMAAERHGLAGSAAQIIEALLRVKALGATHVVLSTQTNDLAQFRQEIETLATAVLPKVRA
jgi:probable F420-dependent oxidoreductase